MSDDPHFRPEISKWFTELLQAHKLPTVPHEDWVTMGGALPAFRGAFHPADEGSASGTVLVQVGLPGERLVTEPIAALGETPEAAIKSALDQVAVTVFHPVVCASHNVAPDDVVTVAEWEDTDRPLAAYVGHPVARYSGTTAPEAPAEMFAAVEEALRAETLEDGLNWISVFVATIRDEDPKLAVNLNNQLWEGGVQRLAHVPWPKDEDGFVSIRCFIMVRKEAPKAENEATGTETSAPMVHRTLYAPAKD